VTKLARRRLQFDGLNLTRASLNAALKYPWPRASLFSPAERHKDDGVDRYKKWGVYSTESEDFEFAREILRGEFGQPGDKKTIEAEIMDWADDVAYALHDVEDFYRAGRIPLERFIKGEPEVVAPHGSVDEG
jgi:dGTPase